MEHYPKTVGEVINFVRNQVPLEVSIGGSWYKLDPAVLLKYELGDVISAIYGQKIKAILPK